MPGRPDELDDLLVRAAPPAPSPPALRTAETLGHQIRPPAGRPRWRLVVGGVALVAVAGGAGTLAASQLSVPPFQTLEPGLVRVFTPIPLTYADPQRGKVVCSVFIELTGATPAEVAAVEHRVTETDWTPAAQAELTGRVAPTSEVQVLGERLGGSLYRLARSVVPVLRPADDEAGGVAFSGYSASCRPAAEAVG